VKCRAIAFLRRVDWRQVSFLPFYDFTRAYTHA